MKWAEAILDLFFPRCCPGCGRVTESERPWCEACIRTFWYPRLLNSASGGALDGCYTCGQYDEGLRAAILRLKYGGQRHLGESFSMLLHRFPWWDRLESYDLAAPVPLSAARMRERGYNQCDLMYQAFMKQMGKTYDPELLVRIRHTKVQSSLDREARRQNVKNAFHLNRRRQVEGRRVLLLDDVYTTGATLREAAKELRRVGAVSVMGFTMASGAP